MTAATGDTTTDTNPTTASSTNTQHRHHINTTTIHDLSDDEVGISLALLGGNGHFRYHGIACKMFLTASEKNPGFKTITTGESVTSSVSCATKYFEDEGTGIKQLRFFWLNAARYGHLDVMEWAHEQGYSAVWTQRYDHDWWGSCRICQKAAEYGQLLALQWLRKNGCDWNDGTCYYAAGNGHLSCLQWARKNGCDWDYYTCEYAASNGHLSCLQWARENGCDWNQITCMSAAAHNGHLNILQWARENGSAARPW